MLRFKRCLKKIVAEPGFLLSGKYAHLRADVLSKDPKFPILAWSLQYRNLSFGCMLQKDAARSAAVDITPKRNQQPNPSRTYLRKTNFGRTYPRIKGIRNVS
jgi:hypothetical protein